MPVGLLSAHPRFHRAARRFVAARNKRCSPTPQPSKLTLEQYFDLEDVQDPQLSPDGKQIIYTRRWVDKLNDRWESSLWIMNADGSRSRHLLDGVERDLVARRNAHRVSRER